MGFCNSSSFLNVEALVITMHKQIIKKILEVWSVKYEEDEALLKFKKVEIQLVQTDSYLAIHSLQHVLKMLLQERLSIQAKT